MKITVLMGSPNRKGSTSILVNEFVRGEETRKRHTGSVRTCTEKC